MQRQMAPQRRVDGRHPVGDVAESTLNVDARALGRRARPAIASAEADGSRELSGELLALGLDARRTLAVTAILGVLERVGERLESSPVARLGAVVQHDAGIAR